MDIMGRYAEKHLYIDKYILVGIYTYYLSYNNKIQVLFITYRLLILIQQTLQNTYNKNNVFAINKKIEITK